MTRSAGTRRAPGVPCAITQGWPLSMSDDEEYRRGHGTVS